MLEIGRDSLNNSLFLFGNSGEYIITRLIDFYDVEGLNCLYITHDYKFNKIKPRCSTLYYNLYSDIPEKLENNLFKINLIIVTVDKNYKLVLNLIRKITDLPILFIGKNIDDFYSLKDFKYVYEMSMKDYKIDINNYVENFQNSSYIRDIINNWESTLKNIEVEYFREKKIELILKNK